jgi:uncharacterized phiE125 gp8 family phage protein
MLSYPDLSYRRPKKPNQKQTLRLKVPPATEPVTLLEATSHLRVDITDDNTYIQGTLIPAAREYCEGILNRAMITQSWELSFDDWPDFPVSIPVPPLASVASITYYDVTNTGTVWPTTEYYVDTDSEPGRVDLADGKSVPNVSLRSINAVKIAFAAGYGATETSIPVKFRQAMLLLIGHWYQNREAVGTASQEIEFAVNSLLGIDRVWPI